MPTVLVIFLLPFMQLGLSYYASIATLSSLCAVVASKWLRHAKAGHFVMTLCIGCVMVASVVFNFRAGIDDIMRTGREALCFIIISGALKSSYRLDDHGFQKCLRALLIVSAGMFALVAIQSIFLLNRTYFGIPASYYVMNSGTIPDELDLIYSRIRPAGTFGEPSYLATVCIVITISLSPMWAQSRRIWWITFFFAATVLMSLSMLGVIAMTATITILIFKTKPSTLVMTLVALPLALLLGAVYLSDSLIAERILRILYGEDLSANSRIFTPIFAIIEVISTSPFGIPFQVMRQMKFLGDVNAPVDSYLHNGMFNMLLFYGITGAVLLLTIFISAKSSAMKFIIFLLLMQNGDMLSIDKCALIVLCCMLHNTAASASRASTHRVANLKIFANART